MDELKIVGFPCAGASSNNYRGISDALHPGRTLHLWDPPGRARRIGEPPFARVEDVVRDAADRLGSLLDPPYALLGHSLGGLVAFELARELRQRGKAAPEALVVVSSQVPHQMAALRSDGEVSDESLVEGLRRANGTPDEIINDFDMLEPFLPAFRADLAIIQDYVFREEDPLPSRIFALGSHRDWVVDARSFESWALHTRGGFTMEWFEGDHFLPTQNPALFGWMLDRVLNAIAQ